MISEHFRVTSMSLAVDRGCFDRGRRRARESHRSEDEKAQTRSSVRIRQRGFPCRQTHGAECATCTFLSPFVFVAVSSPVRSVGLLTYRLIARIPSSCEPFFVRKSDGHVHARTCAICLRVQCPLILARYTLANDSLQRSAGGLYVTRKSTKSQLFPNWLKDRHAVNTHFT